MKKKYYAYLLVDNNISDIVESWESCQKIIKGKKARFKSFSSEKEAKIWLEQGGIYENKKEKLELLKKELEEAIYFDAGTGRGIGVEVRVTDKTGKSLLYLLENKIKINEFGNYLAPKDSTNNYGELIGIFLALEIANILKINKIFGDSNLVLNYWSKGVFNKNNLNEKTINLIEKTTKKRENFEKNSGIIEYISGAINPADLGFHK